MLALWRKVDWELAGPLGLLLLLIIIPFDKLNFLLVKRPINPYGKIKGILTTDWITVDSIRMSLLNSTFPSASLKSNQTGIAIPEVSTTFDPSTTFYMGSYDSIITQWAYTADRDIKFQGTVVCGSPSAPSWLSYSADYRYVYATLEYANKVQVNISKEVTYRFINFSTSYHL